MKLTISIVLSVLLGSANVKADDKESCAVRDTYHEECVLLKNCTHYINLIRNSASFGLTQQDVFKMLGEVNCGFIGVDPLVCCPTSTNSGNQTADSPPTGSGNSQQTGSTSSGISINTPVPTTQPTASTVSTTVQVPLSTTTLTGKPVTVPSTTQKTTETTTPAAPENVTKDTTSQAVDKAKFKILPEDCGIVLQFKYFRGNRTDFDDFPWTTLVEYTTPTGKIFGCGGALIHDRYVLTAAHCVADLPPSWKVSKVRFGEYDIATDVDCLPDGPNAMVCNEPPVDFAVEQVIVHPGFMSGDANRLHDIALLRLSASVNFTDNIKPICLPTKTPFPQRYYTTGWGKDLTKGSIDNGTNLKYMSYVSLVITPSTCERSYAKKSVKLSQSHLCGGFKLGEKSCIGDAGGPLMGLEEIPNLEKRVVAFGVLSLSKPAAGECKSGQPSTYTKVLDYMDWILTNIRQ